MQRVYITHVKQTHMPPAGIEVTKTEKDDVAYSQFNVCRAIIANPDALVVQEGLHENYTPELVSKNQNTVRAKQVFSNGIPEHYEELNSEQKDYLARRTGPVTLFDLGILSHIYKSIGKVESDQINALIAAGHFNVIYAARERLAIKYAKEAAKSAAEQNVNILLVFGGVHDFASRIQSSADGDNLFYSGYIETSLHDDEMTSSETTEMLYKLSDSAEITTNDAVSLFSKNLTFFEAKYEKAQPYSLSELLEKIPSSEDELPMSVRSNEDMQSVARSVLDALSLGKRR